MFTEESLLQLAKGLSPHLIPAIGDYIIEKLRGEKVIPDVEENTYYPFEIPALYLKNPGKFKKVSTATVSNWIAAKALLPADPAAKKKAYKESDIILLMNQKSRWRKELEKSK